MNTAPQSLHVICDSVYDFYRQNVKIAHPSEEVYKLSAEERLRNGQFGIPQCMVKMVL